jgi:plastocyanin
MTLVRLRQIPAIAALVLALACGGGGGTGPANQCMGIQNGTGGASAAAVSVKDNDPVSGFYEPSSVTVPVSSSVTWTWAGMNPHSVTFQGAGCPTSQTQTTGTYQLTFTTPGTFNYFCLVHPNMNGSVTVTP